MNIGGYGGLGIPLGGLQDASRRLSDSAQRVASAGLAEDASPLGARDVDLAQEAVNQKIATYDYRANLKSLDAQSKMQKEVIDILA